MPVVIYNNTERSPLMVLLVLFLMSIIYASVFLHVATSVNRKLIYLSIFIKLLGLLFKFDNSLIMEATIILYPSGIVGKLCVGKFQERTESRFQSIIMNDLCKFSYLILKLLDVFHLQIYN